MRFIVDIYRVLILACFGVMIAIATLLVLSMGDLPDPLQGLGLGAIILLMIVMVIGVGTLAILFSIHDRHVEVAEDLARIADALERSHTITGGRDDG